MEVRMRSVAFGLIRLESGLLIILGSLPFLFPLIAGADRPLYSWPSFAPLALMAVGWVYFTIKFIKLNDVTPLFEVMIANLQCWGFTALAWLAFEGYKHAGKPVLLALAVIFGIGAMIETFWYFKMRYQVLGR